MNEFGIAAWLFNKRILVEKSMIQLDVPAACRAIGVKTVDLVSSYFPSQTAAYLNELREELRAADVRVHAIAIDMGDISDPDDAKRRTDIEALKQWFFTARALGATAIRVNSGGNEKSRPGEIGRTIASYRELVEVASQLEIGLLVENHGGVSNSAVLLDELFAAIPSQWFGSCPDSGNFVDGSWDASMKVMAPRAHSCHVKLTEYSESGMQPRSHADGRDRTCDLMGFFQQLKDCGYRGPINLELGLPQNTDEIESAREGLAYLGKLLQKLN